MKHVAHHVVNETCDIAWQLKPHVAHSVLAYLYAFWAAIFT